MLLGAFGIVASGCATSGGGGGGGGDDPCAGVTCDEGEECNPGTGECEPSAPSDPVYDCAGAASLSHGAFTHAKVATIPEAVIPKRARDAKRPATKDLSNSRCVLTPCDQGTLNSCVGWAGAYGLMTYLASNAIDGWGDREWADRHFSPSFVFNQVNSYRMGNPFEYSSCQQAGADWHVALKLLRDTGCCTWADMPYDKRDCASQPGTGAVGSASDFTIDHFDNPEGDLTAALSLLARDIPLFVVVQTGEAFNELGAGEVLSEVDTEGGLHAVLVVGYDDDRRAVKFMNSWGTGWGDGGFGFISYDIWSEIAYDVYEAGSTLNTPFESVADVSGGKWVRNAQANSGRTGCSFNPKFDSDGDGYTDNIELIFADLGFDPDVPDDDPVVVEQVDLDGDGWPDLTEVAFGTDPREVDDFPFVCGYEYPEGFFDDPVSVPCVEYFLFDLLRFHGGGSGPRGVAVVDVNGDGLADVVLANNDFDDTGTGANVTVLLSQGDGMLGDAAVIADSPAPRYVTAGDLDGDGAVDVVFTDDDLETVNVLMGNGDGTFVPAAGGALAADGGAGPVALADLDGSGTVDLIVPRTNDMAIFDGVGDGTFLVARILAGGLQRTPIVPADFDGDALIDLAAYAESGSNFGVAVLLGADGWAFRDDRFVALGEAGLGVAQPIALATGDFDGDGNTDVAAARIADDRVFVLLGAGDGTLPARQDVLTDSAVIVPDGLTAADLDADGLDDLVLAVQTAEAVVLRSNGDGTFTESRNRVADDGVLTTVTVAVGDLDGDGDADLAVPGVSPTEVAALRSVCER